jgi:cell division protein ZapA
MTTKQIEVSILGQPYRLAAEMSKIRSHSNVRGIDRIAVMAALSLASELLKLQSSVRHGEAFPAEEIRRTMHQMNEQLGTVIQQYSVQ